MKKVLILVLAVCLLAFPVKRAEAHYTGYYHDHSEADTAAVIVGVVLLGVLIVGGIIYLATRKHDQGEGGEGIGLRTPASPFSNKGMVLYAKPYQPKWIGITNDKASINLFALFSGD